MWKKWLLESLVFVLWKQEWSGRRHHSIEVTIDNWMCLFTHILLISKHYRIFCYQLDKEMKNGLGNVSGHSWLVGGQMGKRNTKRLGRVRTSEGWCLFTTHTYKDTTGISAWQTDEYRSSQLNISHYLSLLWSWLIKEKRLSMSTRHNSVKLFPKSPFYFPKKGTNFRQS